MDEKQLERLKAPFAMEAHDWKPGATTKDKKRALGLAYVDSRQYQARLDEVDPEWSNSYTPLVVDSRIVVNCKLIVLGITREDVGECSLRDDNAYTSAVALSMICSSMSSTSSAGASSRSSRYSWS